MAKFRIAQPVESGWARGIRRCPIASFLSKIRPPRASAAPPLRYALTGGAAKLLIFRAARFLKRWDRPERLGWLPKQTARTRHWILRRSATWRPPLAINLAA